MTVATKEKKQKKNHSKKARGRNLSLSESLYPIVHFNSGQTDSVDINVNGDWGDGSIETVITLLQAAGPVNIMTFTTSDENYMWQVGTDKVSYLHWDGYVWSPEASCEALSENSDDFDPIDPDILQQFGRDIVTDQTTPQEMAETLEAYFDGSNYAERLDQSNGLYAVVDSQDRLYVHYAGALLRFSPPPRNGTLTWDCRLEDAADEIGSNRPGIVGLAMTYDDHLVVTLRTGVAVIDQELTLDMCALYEPNNENGEQVVSNSVAVDQNAIYLVSNSDTMGYLQKVAWDGTSLSVDTADGWVAEYLVSDDDPPVIKFGSGSGSTPTLMDASGHELVVITDGQQVMNLRAFWRDTGEDAGQIQVTCGLDLDLDLDLDDPDTWIQTEQSVVVSGNGALVVNNIPTDYSQLKADSDDGGIPSDSMVQLMLLGPYYKGPTGAQRFEWTYEGERQGSWESIWYKSDVPATSMVPVHCGDEGSGIAVISGYNPSTENWELNAIDWVGDGSIVGTINLGKWNFGNGGYSLPQFLDENRLIYNSVAGPLLIDLQDLKRKKGSTKR